MSGTQEKRKRMKRENPNPLYVLFLEESKVEIKGEANSNI